MQRKLCATYFQDAPSNQAFYPISLPDISPDPYLLTYVALQPVFG
jgi:hypothetical protein